MDDLAIDTVHIKSKDDFEYDEEDDYIDSGGFCEVYRGRMKATGEQIAVKVLRGRRNKEESAGLRKEAAILLRVPPHPNIVKCLGLCDNPKSFSLLLEYFQSGDLLAVLTDDPGMDSWLNRINCSLQISSGMAFLHSLEPSITHRDLKTRNVLVKKAGKQFVCKISDFGLAKMRGISTRTKQWKKGESPRGTAAYIPPERYSDRGPAAHSSLNLDKKHDVYSFGVICWEIREREEVFKDENDVIIQGKIMAGNGLPASTKSSPGDFGKLLEDCASNNPRKRPLFPDILSFLESLYKSLLSDVQVGRGRGRGRGTPSGFSSLKPGTPSGSSSPKPGNYTPQGGNYTPQGGRSTPEFPLQETSSPDVVSSSLPPAQPTICRENCLLLFGLPSNASQTAVISMVEKAASRDQPVKATFVEWREFAKETVAVVELSKYQGIVNLWKSRHVASTLKHTNGKSIAFDIDHEDEYEEDQLLVQNIPKGADVEDIALQIKSAGLEVLKSNVKIIKTVFLSSKTEAVVFLDDSVADQRLVDDLGQYGADFELPNSTVIKLVFRRVPVSRSAKLSGVATAKGWHKGNVRKYLFEEIGLDPSPLVEDVEAIDKNDCAIVTFRTTTDLSAVMNLDTLPSYRNSDLHISRYSIYPSLADAHQVHEREEERAEEFQLTLSAPEIHPDLMDFMVQNPPAHRKLKELGDVVYESGILTLKGLSNESENQWAKNMKTKFFKVYDSYTLRKIPVPEEFWKQAIEQAGAENLMKGTPILIRPHSDNGELVFAGEKQMTDTIHQACSESVRRWTQEKADNERQISDKLPIESSAHFALLKSTNIFSGIEGDVTVEHDATNQRIVISGAAIEVARVKDSLMPVIMSIRDNRVQIHPLLAEFFRGLGREQLTSVFSKASCEALPLAFDNEQPCIRILAMKDHYDAAVSLLKTNFKTEQFEAEDSETRSFLQGPTGAEKLEQLCSRYSVMVNGFGTFDSDEFFLAGTVENVKLFQRDYKQYLSERVVYKTSLKLPGKFCVNYLKRFCKKEIEAIESQLKDYNAKVEFKFRPRSTVHLHSVKGGALSLKSKISEIVDKLKYRRGQFKKHAVKKYMSSDAFQREKKDIESEDKVIIRCGKEDDDSEEEESTLAQFDSVHVSSHLSSNDQGKRISLYVGDICKHHVDAIVNAANDSMAHGGGLAGHIVSCAGYEVQQECYRKVEREIDQRVPAGKALYTSSGRLTSTKFIIHAVGPNWPSGKSRRSKEGEKAESLIRKVVKSSLEIAENLNLRSVAFPAIGAGIFRCPPDAVAENMVRAADSYFAGNVESSVEQVHFIMLARDVENVRSFKRTLEELADTSSHSTVLSTESRREKQSPERSFRKPVLSKFSATRKDHRPSNVWKSGGTSVLLKSGDITKEQVDGIVNSSNNDLNLDFGQSSKAIMRAAGADLQKECRKSVKNEGKLTFGDVRVTRGYQLPASHVLHLVCPTLFPKLANVVEKCLTTASKLKMSSIAFPALGTGGVGMADDQAASALFSGIDQYFAKSRKSHIRRIIVTVFDNAKLPIYQRAIAKHAASEDNSSDSIFGSDSDSLKRTGDSENSDSSSDDDLDARPTSSSLPVPTLANEVTLANGCLLKVEEGNVISDMVDVAVVTNGVLFDALVSADATLKSQLKSLSKSADFAELVTGNLNCRRVYIVPIPNCDASQNDSVNSQKIALLVEKCLTSANKSGYSSISIPAIGTGGLGYSNVVCADGILDAAKSFSSKTPTPSLKRIKISVYDAHRVEDFETELQNRFVVTPSHSASTGVWSKIVGGLKSLVSAKTPSAPKVLPSIKRKKKKKEMKELPAGDPESVAVAIVGGSQFSCDSALARVKKAVDHNCIDKEYKGKLPQNFDHDEITRITKRRRVEFTLKEKKEGTLFTFHGLREDVHEAYIEVQDFLSGVMKEEHEELETATIAMQVNWLVEGKDDAFKSYKAKEIKQLEEAYIEDSNSVCELNTAKGAVKVDFSTMTQTDKKGRRKIVKRELFSQRSEVKELEVPSNWKTTKLEDTANTVSLTPGSLEYVRVAQSFAATFGGSTHTIKKIERVENVALYNKYLAEKRLLGEKRKTEIAARKTILERELYHGTPTNAQTIGQIINNGFNRSYAGTVKGKAYGAGVYFANHSSTSHGYTSPDGSGDLTMFYCHVLMGLSCVGSQGMVQPPLVDPKKSQVDNFDSTVNNVQNPTIFVSCYRDNMAYPAYIITYQ
ncbi:protein mono-ADP-ribosyltransferase PARP14-like isoform X3 [Oscarella lobularis]|uniref:protein mono-ADP-ribosyltransferase PARP14-like isoform X3 n=1 Tax=Oscarella lobularis TaxID=121494 RepID=UPI003313FDCC